jgi:hypothetical protein
VSARRDAALLVALCALLAACTGVRTTGSARAPAGTGGTPSTAAPGAAASAATETEAAPPSPPVEEPPSPPAAAGEASNAANCSCAQAQPKSKPKSRPRAKPKTEPEPAPPPPQTAAVVAPPAEVVNAQVAEIGTAVTSILGKRVHGLKGEDLGRVVDVLADSSGRVRVAIIDFGGFLGVGNRRIAVDWPLLHFDPQGGDNKVLILTLSRQKLQSAPEYKESARPRILVPPPDGANAGAVDAAETKK